MTTQPSSGYGFAQLQAIAAQRLGWQPHQFWDATPIELVVSLRPSVSADADQGCSREDLAALMARFPDPCNKGPVGTSINHEH